MSQSMNGKLSTYFVEFRVKNFIISIKFLHQNHKQTFFKTQNHYSANEKKTNQ
jgi:hypothetical protein